jgi:pyrimidine-specific ribonucleoside hydrolase
MSRRIPIIDLYHPHQDPGDNFAIIAPYARPEIDLRAVILDVSECFRRWREEREPEDYNLNNSDAGFIPIMQCNSMFQHMAAPMRHRSP